ncbi:LacI family DNA-binding transcriptional regulator [Pseudomonas sp. dw_358]|uniref:LacI family DNA-binding transcriptional regulator n=1 Tax=Pseudomonas sp. dw_358 TaxID=2720083 RepID=UPI001BD42EEC|nr:LacI family DNA-binding transcriptional regulator [Pseudomonas sp. dw_358]
MSNPKPTMIEVAKAAGVGVATVDRVINQRAPVSRKTSERVYQAAERLGLSIKENDSLAPAPSVGKGGLPAKRLAMVLQSHNPPFYATVTQALTAAVSQAGDRVGEPTIVQIDAMRPEEVADTLMALGKQVDSIALVAADHPIVSQAIEQLATMGVRTYALMTDLTAAQRAGYIGLDNRKVGRTAGWAMAHLSKRVGKVATLMGDHRVLCQEFSEIGFRSYFRENFSDYEVLAPLPNQEGGDSAYVATCQLLEEHSDLVGLYINSGGVEGVVRALRETGRHRDLVTICHEVTDSTRRALIDNVVQLLVAHPLEQVARTLVEVMLADQPGNARQWVLPFSLLTAENL